MGFGGSNPLRSANESVRTDTDSGVISWPQRKPGYRKGPRFPALLRLIGAAVRHEQVTPQSALFETADENRDQLTRHDNDPPALLDQHSPYSESSQAHADLGTRATHQ